MTKIQFGTDGWRAIIGTEINAESVRAVAYAFAQQIHATTLPARRKIAVGYDGRKFSKEFAEIFARKLQAHKIQCFLSDKIISTPCLSYFVVRERLSAGVMITASHNPPEYNGIKFKDHHGGPFTTEQTAQVEERLLPECVIDDDIEIECTDMEALYLEHLIHRIDLKAIKNAGINPLIDSMGGAGKALIEKLLQSFDIPAETIFGVPDETFYNREPEPIEKNLLPLKEKLMQEGGFSLGIATDGDADRLGLLDESGNWISAQTTILLFADYLIRQKGLKGDIVKSVSVTAKLKRLESKTCKIIEVPVGFKFISEKMREREAVAGFEESGGYGFSSNFPERDGIYSALLIMEIIASSGKKYLSDLINDLELRYGKIHYDRIDHKYYEPDRLKLLPRFVKNMGTQFMNRRISKIKKYENSRGHLNGIKIYFRNSDSWLLIRCSETEPMFRVYAEGNSDEEVKLLLTEGFNSIIHNK